MSETIVECHYNRTSSTAAPELWTIEAYPFVQDLSSCGSLPGELGIRPDDETAIKFLKAINHAVYVKPIHRGGMGCPDTFPS
jgi:hypothetical protein